MCTATKVELENTANPKKSSFEVRESLKSEHAKAWEKKPQHGYLVNKQQKQTDYDKEATNAWLKDQFMPSHIEGYICAIQEQEIRTRQLIFKREDPTSSPKCRFCKTAEESIFHILNSCNHLSISMYLPVRHDEVAKIVYYELLRMHTHDVTHESKTPDCTVKTDKIEVWWDKKIAVQPSVENNRPDIVFWDLEKKECRIIDICVPMDVNVKREEKVKCDKYIILASRLQRLYPNFTFDTVPIVLGSTGYISKSLRTNLEKCGFDTNKSLKMIPILQSSTWIGQNCENSVEVEMNSCKMRIGVLNLSCFGWSNWNCLFHVLVGHISSTRNNI